MKRIKYKFLSSTQNIGTEEKPELLQHFFCKDFKHTEETEAAAKREAYDGIYEIYDDGQPEPEPVKTDAERIKELEEALALLLEGATE
jgi:hypothetical protein